MIIARNPAVAVPARSRAERIEIVLPRTMPFARLILRPAFCPICKAHRTLVIDAFEWEPAIGVKHVPCELCVALAVASGGIQ